MKSILLLLGCIHFCSISLCQNVGINITNPGFPLNFPATLGDKISLWGSSGNHYGFGIQSNLLQIHSLSAGDDIAFGYGSSASFNEVMRIKGNGNVGIGTITPSLLLHVAKNTNYGIGDSYGIAATNAGNPSLRLNLGYDATIDGAVIQASDEGSTFNKNLLLNPNAGNIGIGVSNPSFRLDIGDRIRLRYGSGGTAGMYFNKNDNSATSAFIGTYTDDNYLGIYGENGAGWNFLMNTADGNVGIGAVPNSNAKLHVYTGSGFGRGFLVSGNLETIYGFVPDFGGGTRMMFYPGKSAFRAGHVTGTEWDNSFVGYYSTASGYNTIASGSASTALGHTTTASGRNSTAIGFQTTSKSYGGLTIGVYNENTDAPEANNINAANRIFQIGNGTANNNRRNAMTVLQNGNTGIGVVFPEQILDVADRIRLRSGPQGTAGLWLNNADNSDLAGFLGTYSNNYIGMYGQAGAVWGLVMNTSNGNVGIGTNNPTYKLAVNGSIRSKEVRVESGWADFVFEKDYKLWPLHEVECFIIENKHLPDIPSAKEIQENGLAVGEMQTKMMQKIEELTLYMIELNKQLNTANKQILDLNNKLYKLENKSADK